MMVQVIKQNDKPEWAVIPYDAYLQLVEKAEMLQDIQDYDGAKAALTKGDDEMIPAEIIHAILDGENAIRVWREFRDLTQKAVAERAGISVPYLSQLERNKRKGSLEVISAVAAAMGVSLELIIPSQT